MQIMFSTKTKINSEQRVMISVGPRQVKREILCKQFLQYYRTDTYIF